MKVKNNIVFLRHNFLICVIVVERSIKRTVLNEKLLIKKCKENDYSSQLALYNSYKDMMYNASFRIVQNREDAEDIVQESFIKGFHKIHQTNKEFNLGAWLRRIVINASLDRLRKRKKLFWIEETQTLEIKETDNIEKYELIDESKLTVTRIMKCLNALKEKYRIILTLYMIEDYNHREISEMLQIKESTVRNQYRRGKHQLIKKFKNK